MRVLLLGDSTVWGSVPRLMAPKADHLEDIVRKRLAGEPDLPPVEVVNQGQDNDTIQRLLAERYDRDVAGLPPLAFIFIRYGINDREYVPDFSAEYPRTYRELIARLRRDQPRAEIILETIIPYRDAVSTREVNDQIRRIASSEDLPVLDTHARYAEALTQGGNMLSYRVAPLEAIPAPLRALLPPEALLDDRVCVLDNVLDAHLREVPGWFADRHPNLAGYHVIGEGLAQALATRLRARVADS